MKDGINIEVELSLKEKNETPNDFWGSNVSLSFGSH